MMFSTQQHLAKSEKRIKRGSREELYKIFLKVKVEINKK